MIKRIVPCLDIKNGKVVKGIKFANLRNVGDPIELARMYSQEKADELALLNISNSAAEKSFLNLVARVRKTIQIPLIVSGKIKRISDIEKLLKVGVNKICLYTSFIKTPELLLELINKIEEKIRNKKIIIGIDVIKKGEKWRVVGEGFESANLDATEWAREIKKRGISEIILTSMDRDGTKKGYDVDLSRSFKENIALPIIIAGGAGKKEDFLEAFTKGKADAALAASIFHSGKIKILELKKYLKQKGIRVNL